MAYDQLKSSAAARALGDVLGDFADLLQKEVRLARAEVSSNLSVKLQGALWMVTAAFLAGASLLLVLQALVIGIASYGVPIPMACLIVACATTVAAALAFLIGRADARATLTPRRTIHHIHQDVILSKEQLR